MSVRPSIDADTALAGCDQPGDDALTSQESTDWVTRDRAILESIRLHRRQDLMMQRDTELREVLADVIVGAANAWTSWPIPTENLIDEFCTLLKPEMPQILSRVYPILRSYDEETTVQAAFAFKSEGPELCLTFEARDHASQTHIAVYEPRVIIPWDTFGLAEVVEDWSVKAELALIKAIRSGLNALGPQWNAAQTHSLYLRGSFDDFRTWIDTSLGGGEGEFWRGIVVQSGAGEHASGKFEYEVQSTLKSTPQGALLQLEIDGWCETDGGGSLFALQSVSRRIRLNWGKDNWISSRVYQ